MSTPATAGQALRAALAARPVLPFIGVYDTFSASLAARRFDTLFLSGYSFAASYYGLPDVGFITWTDMVAFVQRLRYILPRTHLLVDLDDGYGDPEVAAHAAASAEAAGASGIVLEDQQRPRKCGHLDGKQIMELEGYLEKLDRVLRVRRGLFVIARTDASDPDEIRRRALAFDRTACDAILVDGMKDLSLLRALRAQLQKPLCFNQMAGGKSPPRSWTELQQSGVSIVIHSAPALFAAQAAVDHELADLQARDGRFAPPGEGRPGLRDCNAILDANLARRHGAND